MNKISKNRSQASQNRAAKTLAKKKFEKCKKMKRSHQSPISKALTDKAVSSATACLNVHQSKKEELKMGSDASFVNNSPRQEEDYMMFSSDDETLLDASVSDEDSFMGKIEDKNPIKKSNILKISTDYHQKSGTERCAHIARAKFNQTNIDSLATKPPENAKCNDTPDIFSILINIESPFKESNHVNVLAESHKTKRRGRSALKDIVKTNVDHPRDLSIQRQLMKTCKLSASAPSHGLAPKSTKSNDMPNFSSILDALGESDRFKESADSPKKRGRGRHTLKDIVKTNVSHTKGFSVQQQLMETSKFSGTPSHSLVPKSAKPEDMLNPFSIFDTVEESNHLEVSADSSKTKRRGRRALNNIVKTDVSHTKGLNVQQQPMKSSELSDTPSVSLTSNVVRRASKRLNNLKISTKNFQIKKREKCATKPNQTESPIVRKEFTNNSKLPDISCVSPILDIVENLDTLKTSSDTHHKKEIRECAAKRIAKTRTSQTRHVGQDSKIITKPNDSPNHLSALGDTQMYLRETRSRNPDLEIVFSSFGITPSKVVPYKRLSSCIPVSTSAVNTSKQINSNASYRTNKGVKIKKSEVPSSQTTCRVCPIKKCNISTCPPKSETKVVKKRTNEEKSDLLLKSFSNESISSRKKSPSCNMATPQLSSVETKQQNTTYDSRSPILSQSNELSPLMISHMRSARVLVKPILKPFQSPLVRTLSPSSSSSVSEPSVAVGCVSDNDDFEDFGFLGCTPLPPFYCGSVKSKLDEVDISCWSDVSQNVTWQPKSAKELLRKETEKKKVENKLKIIAKRKELNQKVETKKVKRIKLNKIRKTIPKSKDLKSKVSKKEKGKIVKQNPKIGSNSEKATSKTSKKSLKQKSTSTEAENPKPTRNEKASRNTTTQKKNGKKPEPEIDKENLKKPKKGKIKQDYMRCLLDVVKNKTFDDNDAFCGMDVNLWRFGNAATSGDMAYTSESEVSGLSYLSSATPPLQHSLMDLSRHSLGKKIVPDPLLADSNQIRKGTNQFGNPNKTANMKKKLEDLSLSESLVKKKKIKLPSKSSSSSPVNIPNFGYNFMDDDSYDDDSDGLASVSSVNVLNVPYLNEVKLAEKKPKEFVKVSLATKHMGSKL